MKRKKPKVESMLELDEKIGHRVEDIYKPISDNNQDEVFPKDFIVEIFGLGLATRVANVKIFNSSNKKVEHRIKKD